MILVKVYFKDSLLTKMKNCFRFSSKKKPGSSDFPDDLRQITVDFLRLPVTSSERSIQPISGVSNHNTRFVLQIRESC